MLSGTPLLLGYNNLHELGFQIHQAAFSRMMDMQQRDSLRLIFEERCCRKPYLRTSGSLSQPWFRYSGNEPELHMSKYVSLHFRSETFIQLFSFCA